jgi:vacuolar-type H+-ATPase subunit F/Vma7
MSRLLVVTRPDLVAGFHLAGVNAFAAEDAAAAQKVIARWLDTGETGLLAVDEDFAANFDAAFRQRLAAAGQLPYLALPSGQPGPWKSSGRGRIAELLRQAIGFHITFHGEQE